MTFLRISRAEDTNEEMGSSDSSVWREVEFESDVEHKEMTRTYGCDDYLSRWLPNIKQKDEPVQLRKEKSEKRQEKEHPNRLFKSPCHHHEGRTLRENKIQSDPTKKTYFEAIKCSPVKLRQSLANFKRPKLEENLTLEPNTALNHRPSNTAGATKHATNLTTSIESMQGSTEKTLTTEKSLTTEKTLGKPVETEKTLGKMRAAKARSSLGIVEMQNDEMGQLGSLCFHKSLPENFYGENIYTPCTMLGGKLRKVYRGTNRDSVLLTGRHKSKELLVRCESIMIYPKDLINQKEQSDKFVANSKQQLEEYAADHQQQSDKYAANHQQQSDKYQVVTNLEKQKFVTKPKEAWNERTGEPPLTVISKTSETNYTQLPQLNIKDQTTQKGNDQNPLPETPLDTSDGRPAVESVQNCIPQPSTGLQMNQNAASTKIIIPFGENESGNQTAERNRSKSEYVGGERGAPMKTRCLIRETATLQKVQGVVSHKTGFQQEEGFEGSMKKAGERSERDGGALMKSRCLKESSKLNEQSHSTRRHSDLVLDVRESGMARKLVITTQYQILNTPNSPLKQFRIPTAVDKSELFAGRENYPPKNKTASFRFAYNQRGVSEYSKSFDGVQDNGGQSLKIGGKGLLKARLSTLSRNDEKLAEDESKKRVQFLVHNSRYFT